MKKIQLHLALLSFVAFTTSCGSNSEAPNTTTGKAFFRESQNCQDLKSYMNDHASQSRSQDSNSVPMLPIPALGTPSSTSEAMPANPSTAPSPSAGVIQSDYSYADNERELLYIIDKRNRLKIYKAAPIAEAALLSQLDLDFNAQEILTLDISNKKYAIVFGNILAPLHEGMLPLRRAVSTSDYPLQKTVLAVIDVSQAQAPSLIQQHIQDGSFVEARALPETGQIVWSSSGVVNPSNFEIAASSFTGTDCSDILLYENKESDRVYPTYLNFYTLAQLNLSSPNPAVTSKSLITGAWSSILSVNPQHIFLTQSATNFENPKSEIFMFNIPKTDKALELEASGTVPGYLLNQFFLDEKDSYVRVFHNVSSNNLPTQGLRQNLSPGSTAFSVGNYLSILEKKGQELVSKAISGPFEETESPYAARFMGKLACIITFERIDPLTCFDLSDPAHPKQLGALEIEGVSFHLENVGSELLLGIGRDGQGGVVANLFDISDPNHPRLASQKRLNPTDTYATSAAFYDYRTLSKKPSEWSYALPFTEYESASQRQYSTVALFKIDVSTREIIVRDGVRTDITLPENASVWEDYDFVQRAHFIGDSLACLSTHQIRLYDQGDLSVHLANFLE